MGRFGAYLFFILAISASGLKAEGQVNIIYSPKSVKFSGQSTIRESLLKEIFSASLGLSVQESAEWNGLNIIDPFNTPEAVVSFSVEGVSGFGPIGKSASYPLATDEPDSYLYDAMSSRILQRYSDNNNIVDINLSDVDQVQASNTFGNVKVSKSSKHTLNFLKSNEDVDSQFLSEIDALSAITVAVNNGAIKPDHSIDFYHFTVKSLHTLSDHYGSQSSEVKEAKQLLTNALEQLTEAFVRAYNGSVLVATVNSDSLHTRRMTRAAEAPVPRANDWNLATAYSADYPVIFNIILWFSVVYVFGLIAVVYAIMDMDPGRDSIIYRMTSMKMKKDN